MQPICSSSPEGQDLEDHQLDCFIKPGEPAEDEAVQIKNKITRLDVYILLWCKMLKPPVICFSPFSVGLIYRLDRNANCIYAEIIKWKQIFLHVYFYLSTSRILVRYDAWKNVTYLSNKSLTNQLNERNVDHISR